MILRGGIFFFRRAVEQMHFQSSSLVLPSKTCNWFNFQLVVKVKPGDSILPPLGTSVPPNAACSREQPVALGRRRNQPQQDKPARHCNLFLQVCRADWTLEKEVGEKEQEMGILTSYGWWGCRSAGTWWWWRRETQRCRCPSPLLLYFVVLLDPPPAASSLPSPNLVMRCESNGGEKDEGKE